ncbi:hypothetical protein ABZ738_04620 [Micromonospora sp. NPDC047793]|uniref:RNA polymerase sigma factor n=1 Tax=Micromonospora sp. NPDC047793 TaxID=3154342 RepID=UPI0033C2062E
MTSIDPTDQTTELGNWHFDPNDPRHEGWLFEYTAFDHDNRRDLERFVRRFAGSRGLSESEVSPESIVQAALTLAALRWPELATKEYVRLWVYKVAGNMVRATAKNRREAWERTAVMPGWTSGGGHHPFASADLPSGVDGEATGQHLSAMIAYRVTINSSLARLPREEQVAVLLTDSFGFRAREVAMVLDCTPEKVASLLRAGRAKLRNDLNDLTCGSMYARVSIHGGGFVAAGDLWFGQSSRSRRWVAAAGVGVVVALGALAYTLRMLVAARSALDIAPPLVVAVVATLLAMIAASTREWRAGIATRLTRMVKAVLGKAGRKERVGASWPRHSRKRSSVRPGGWVRRKR